MRLQLVVYDLDGTLVDSRRDLAASVNAMLVRMDLPPHDLQTVVGFVGEGMERLVRRALGPAHEQRYEEAAPLWWQEYSDRLLDETRLYPGLEHALELPHDKAVLTNKPGVFARAILEGLGLRGFKRVIGGDEAARKPAPDGLERICAELKVPREAALLVGDSAIDVATGRNAGVRTCAAGWGFGERASLAGADFLCDTPAQLARLLARLAS